VVAVEGKDKHRKSMAVGFLPDVLRRFDATNLVQFLQDTNSPLSPYAALALGYKFEPQNMLPPSVLTALTDSLGDPRPLVRCSAADALGRLRESAEPAAPALLDLWTDPDQSVRVSATNAFFELPFYSLLRQSRPAPWGMSQEQAEMYERRYGIRASSFAGSKLLDHSDIRIREMATNALRKLSGSNVVNQAAENAGY
jgi:HEAT repeat protein